MVSVASSELASFALRLLADLPRPVTLLVRLPGWPVPVRLTTSRRAGVEAAKRSAVALSPLEYEALALGLEDGRVARSEALEALQRRASYRATDPGRIDASVLMGPVRASDAGVLVSGPAGERWRYTGRWTVGRFVEALGGELVGVEIEGETGADAGASVGQPAGSEAA